MQAAEAAEAKLKAEEVVKGDLCRDLSELVAKSADAQLVRGGRPASGPRNEFCPSQALSD